MYTYDNNGNIVERCEYEYTSKTGEELSELECNHFSYDYDGDKLVSYNGESFVYNNLGNPTTYRDKVVTWQYGKYLASYNGTTFTYDGLGRRVTKGGITFTYDNENNLIKQSNGLEFIYDNNGVVGVKYNGAQYFYRKDAQGNIIALLDSNGKVVVKYVYDAWGNHAIVAENGTEINSGIGVLNPFRYRGYYYDTETGLYYLQTRYYDPEVGRFISQDSIDYADPETINGLNLYAYCGNNPVSNVDPNGNAWWNWLISGLQIVAGIVLVATGVGAGLGASLIVGGTLGMVGNIVGSQIAGGLGSMANGWGAISTGLSLFSYGWVGAIAGGVMVAVGAGTMAFGANEVVAGVTGTNYIQEWTGMSDSLYGGLYFGLNIVSSIGTIAGRLGMRAASTFDGHVVGKAKPYSRITDGYKTVQYDGRGKLYWSIHRSNHGKSWTSNPHWHTGAGRDGNHFNSYIKLIINLIFRR